MTQGTVLCVNATAVRSKDLPTQHTALFPVPGRNDTQNRPLCQKEAPI